MIVLVKYWQGDEMLFEHHLNTLSIEKSSIIKLFSDHLTIEWWKMLLIGLVLLAFNTFLFLVFSYIREGNVIEYGFPKMKNKTLKKRIKNYSIPARLLLINLTIDAKRHGFFLILNLICQFFNIVAMVSCLVGFVGCMITLADGWCLMLLLASVLVINLVITVIMFIPDLIYLPSERRKYTFFR